MSFRTETYTGRQHDSDSAEPLPISPCRSKARAVLHPIITTLIQQSPVSCSGVAAARAAQSPTPCPRRVLCAPADKRHDGQQSGREKYPADMTGERMVSAKVQVAHSDCCYHEYESRQRYAQSGRGKRDIERLSI